MFKRILSILLIFITVFNIGCYSYKKTEVLGADIAIVGGVTYSAEKVAELILAMLATTGGAYIVNENRDNIKQFAVDTADSYSKFLEEKKETVKYSADMYAEWLNNATQALSNGFNKTVNITSDMYVSFKEFIKELCVDVSSNYEYDINPDISYSAKYNRIYNGVTYTEYVPQYLNSSIGNTVRMRGGSVLGCVYYYCTVKSGSKYYQGISMYYKNADGTLYPQCDSRQFYADTTGDLYIYSSYPIVKIPVNGATYDEMSIAMDSFKSNYTNYSFTFGNDIPSWRKPIENNDIKIRTVDGNPIMENYDIISRTGSYVNDGVVVGDRSITVPQVGVLEDLYNRYLKGELTYQEYINLVNKSIGVIGVDTTSDDVIVNDRGVTLPLDTPIINDKTLTDEKEVVSDVITEEREEVNESSVSDFPDLTEIFPFCIPFDVLRLLKIMKSTPTAPYFEIPVDIPWFGVSYTMIVDFTQFEMLSHITRSFLSIIWVVFLILSTRKLIKA